MQQISALFHCKMVHIVGIVVANSHDPYPYIILEEYEKLSLVVIMDPYNDTLY